MIVAITSMKMKPGLRDKFIQAALVCRAATYQEKGCTQYDYVLSPADADGVLCVEQWEDMNCAFAHMKTEHFQTLSKTTHDTVASFSLSLFDATPSHALDQFFPPSKN
jgi:quinol monooxygenase YgiN